MTKLSKVSFFLFVSIYSYLWLRIIMFPYFYNEYGNIGMFYIAIIIVAILLFFALIPKKILTFDYGDSYKKSYFKYVYSVILLLENIFGISFAVYLLSKIFILTGNYYVMLGFIGLALVALSLYHPKDIMEISTLFIMVGYAILTLTLFSYPSLDMTLIFPIKKAGYWALPFFVIMFIGNNLTLLIHKKDIRFSKLNFIMAMLFSLLLFAIEYFVLISTAGDVYFKNLNWVGFLILSIEPISKYIGNFDFAYIFYIMICCIFKYSYNLSVIRNSMDINKKVMSVFSFITIFCLGIVCFLCIPMNQFYFGIISIVLLSSFSIFFWFLKECYYVRKIKE